VEQVRDFRPERKTEGVMEDDSGDDEDDELACLKKR